MANDNTANTGGTCRVGMGQGTHERGGGVTITVSPFGDGGLYVARATGDLQVSLSSLRQVIASVIHKARAKAEADAPGLPGAVPAIADALTALRLSVEAAKGASTRAVWWHRHYFRLAAETHFRLFPGVSIADPYAAAIMKARQVAQTNPPAPVFSLWHERNRRQEAERIAAAAAIAAERERKRIAAHIREGAGGQLEIAL